MVRRLKTEDWFHADGFPVAVERRDPQEPFGLHAHEFSELVVITEGSGLHVTGKESWPLSAGDVQVMSEKSCEYEMANAACAAARNSSSPRGAP